MTRKKVTEKNVSVSISIPYRQKKFIESHPAFKFSKFVQLHLEDFINLTLDVERLDQEVKDEETT